MPPPPEFCTVIRNVQSTQKQHFLTVGFRGALLTKSVTLQFSQGTVCFSSCFQKYDTGKRRWSNLHSLRIFWICSRVQNWGLKFYFGDKTLQFGRIVAPQRIRQGLIVRSGVSVIRKWWLCNLLKMLMEVKIKIKYVMIKRWLCKLWKCTECSHSALTPLSCPLIADSIT